MKIGIQYPHVFEGEALTVLDKLKGWAMDETPRSSSEDHIWKNDTGKRNTSDFDMLRTYSTGLLAVCLTLYVIKPFAFPLPLPYLCVLIFLVFDTFI